MCACLQGEHIQHAMTILDHGIGRDKILIYAAQGEDNTPEEVILSIQGYLVKAKMPPITHESEYVICMLWMHIILTANASIARTKVLHTEQYLQVTGLDNAQFGEAAVAMLSIHQLFSKLLVKGSMHDWEVKREQEHIVLDFHNPYLTLREKAVSSNIIDIPQDIDPFGILKKHVTNEVFTTDSIIQCFQRMKGDGPSK